MNGAAAIEEVVRAWGIRTVFSLSGAQHAPVLDVFDRGGYRIVGGRTESGVVGAADGYARVSGRPGLALIIAGQGLVNAVAGLACAQLAGSPVVVLVARPPLGAEEAAGSELHWSTACAEPVVKWCRTVKRRERLAEFVEMAMAVATAGRPGPAVLAIPSDLLWADGPGAGREPGAGPRQVPLPAAVDPAAVQDVTRVLAGRRRPVCVVGPSARREGVGSEELSRLRDVLGFPIVGEGAGRGILAEDFEHCFSWPVAQTALAQADFVLAVGCRLDRQVSWLRPPWTDRSAFIAEVTRTPEAAAWGRLPDRIVVGELAHVVDGLVAATEQLGWQPDPPAWMGEALRERLAAVDAVADELGAGLNPIAIARRLMAALRQPAVFVGDGADTLSWAHGVIRLGQGGLWLDHRPLGSMGTGFPLAIGAAAAEEEARGAGEPGRPVVLLTGDGAFGYQLAELETASRCHLPLSIIVANDGAWGTEYHGQLRAVGRAINTELTQARYDLAAQGLGCQGVLARDIEELDAALARVGQDGPSPLLVNVPTDLDSGRLRKEQPLLQMIFHDDVMLREAQAESDIQFSRAQRDGAP